MKSGENKFLDFNSINKEAEDFYKTLKDLYYYTKKQESTSLDKQSKVFFQEKKYFFNKLIERLIYSDKHDYGTQSYYTTLGLLYELLTKTCLLKRDWAYYTKNYSKIWHFEDAKNEILKILKKELNEKQFERMKDILTHVQIQRNNFAHNPLQSFEHYAIQKQLYLGLITLDKIFDIQLNVAPLVLEIEDDEETNKMMGVSRPLDFEPAGLEEALKDKKLQIKKEKWKQIADRNFIIGRLESMAPDEIKTEDIDGTYYPQDIDIPDIAYVPPAEPHVFVTDWYDNPKEWYSLESFIPRLAEQAFASYYKGFYQASFLVAVNCIELTLKYEYLKKKIIEESKLTTPETSLGQIIKLELLQKLNLEKYYDRLGLVNRARNGLLHFNFKQLKEATVKILLSKSPPRDVKVVNFVMGVGPVERSNNPEDDYHVPTGNYDEWSRFAYFAYTLMHEITSELYGKHLKWKHLKAGLDDYGRKKNQTQEDSHKDASD